MKLPQRFPNSITREVQGYTITFLAPEIAAVVIAWLSEDYAEWQSHMEAIGFEQRLESHYQIARQESNRMNFKLACHVCEVAEGGNLWRKIVHLEKDLPL